MNENLFVINKSSVFTNQLFRYILKLFHLNDEAQACNILSTLRGNQTTYI